MKFNKICVLGLGYIGLPTASIFAMHGLHVVGVDVDPRVLGTLRNGGIHIQEPGLCQEVEAAFKTGTLTISEKPVEADAFIIAVPTPFLEGKSGEYDGRRYKLADLRAVISATESIVPVLRRGNLVVLESTSPPRTTSGRVASLLEKSGLRAGVDFYLAYSPERVLPGRIMQEMVENARVVGGINPESAAAARELYATFVKGKIVTTDATTAEMVKLMENTYRDVNIAIANEFSRLADRFGIDVWQAIEIANLHPRVKILNPGPGVGGHCISVDPWFLVEAAPEITPLIHHARLVNDYQPHFVVEWIKRTLDPLKGKRISAWGLSYKPDVDDLRESPSLEVIRLLEAGGAQVKAYEPFKPDAELPGIRTVPSLDESLKDAEAILLLVRHTMFCELNPEELIQKTKARLVFDTVHAVGGKAWEKAGFSILRLGARG